MRSTAKSPAMAHCGAPSIAVSGVTRVSVLLTNAALLFRLAKHLSGISA